MKIDICTVIFKIKADAQVAVSGDDINTLEWHDNNPTNITNKQILDKQSELQALEMFMKIDVMNMELSYLN